MGVTDEAAADLIRAFESGRFPLGRLVQTPGVVDKVDVAELMRCMGRHVAGDWGELSVCDKRRNEEALAVGDRVLSAYTVAGVKIWIITEWNRQQTTALLPEEY
jgi:cyanophycinase-like exopeptidase